MDERTDYARRAVEGFFPGRPQLGKFRTEGYISGNDRVKLIVELHELSGVLQAQPVVVPRRAACCVTPDGSGSS